MIFAKIHQIGSKILEICSNFTPCKSNGSKFSCTLVSYPNLIALVPPDTTSFVGRNERNKVGVRDGGGAKRKRSTENIWVMSFILEMRALQYKYSNIMMPDFLVTCCTRSSHRGVVPKFVWCFLCPWARHFSLIVPWFRGHVKPLVPCTYI